MDFGLEKLLAVAPIVIWAFWLFYNWIRVTSKSKRSLIISNKREAPVWVSFLLAIISSSLIFIGIFGNNVVQTLASRESGREVIVKFRVTNDSTSTVSPSSTNDRVNVVIKPNATVVIPTLHTTFEWIDTIGSFTTGDFKIAKDHGKLNKVKAEMACRISKLEPADTAVAILLGGADPRSVENADITSNEALALARAQEVKTLLKPALKDTKFILSAHLNASLDHGRQKVWRDFAADCAKQCSRLEEFWEFERSVVVGLLTVSPRKLRSKPKETDDCSQSPHPMEEKYAIR